MKECGLVEVDMDASELETVDFLCSSSVAEDGVCSLPHMALYVRYSHGCRGTEHTILMDTSVERRKRYNRF